MVDEEGSSNSEESEEVKEATITDPVKFMERNLGNISCIPQNHNLMLFNQTQNHVGEDTLLL